VTYRATNTPRLVATVAVLTLGETACEVFSRFCTIHGWRPISVRIQPKIAAMYGNAIATTAIHPNHRAFSSLRLRYSHAPTAAIPNITTPRIAITRIDQYINSTRGM